MEFSTWIAHHRLEVLFLLAQGLGLVVLVLTLAVGTCNWLDRLRARHSR